MSDKLYDIPTDWLGRAYVKDNDYRAMYERSIKDPNGFWANEAKRLHWYKPPSRIKRNWLAWVRTNPICPPLKASISVTIDSRLRIAMAMNLRPGRRMRRQAFRRGGSQRDGGRGRRRSREP